MVRTVFCSLIIFAVAFSGAASDGVLPAADRSAAWPPAFGSFIGRHKTIGNRVLAFESKADKRAYIAVGVLDMLLEEASNDRAISAATRRRHSDVTRFFTAVHNLLTRHRFLYPPCRLVETLTDSLTPKSIPREDLERARRKNARRSASFDDANGVWFFSDCDTTSLIYMSIGEHVGVSLSLIEVPRHNFLRYCYSDGSYVNWDPNAGRTASDREYVLSYGVSSSDVVNKRYLQPLSEQEIAGYLLMLRGNQFEEAEMWCQAEDDFRESIALYPQSAVARNALAWMYVTSPAFDDSYVSAALQHAEAAVSCDPENSDYLDTLAWAYAWNGEFDRAAATEGLAAQHATSSEWRQRYLLRAETFKRGATEVDEPPIQSDVDQCNS